MSMDRGEIVKLIRSADVYINNAWEGATGWITEAEANRIATAIEALRASAAPEEGTIVLMPPTPDQQEYLDKIKRETGKYDPNFLVTGSKKGPALFPDSRKAASVAWQDAKFLPALIEECARFADRLIDQSGRTPEWKAEAAVLPSLIRALTPATDGTVSHPSADREAPPPTWLGDEGGGP